MTPALIDVHVRQPSTVAPQEWASQARAAGLDGLLLVALDLPPSLSPGVYEGLSVYCGVELDTEIGRLICVPAEDDVWFRGAGWRSMHGDEVGYRAAEVAREFRSRGGAVLLAQPFDRDLDHQACEDAFVGTEGLTGVVVASAPRHAASNDRAAAAAARARLPGLGGSAAAPGEARFGGVATLFAEAPTDQTALVVALRAGKLWPVEIETPVIVADSDSEDDDEEDGPAAGGSANVSAAPPRPAPRPAPPPRAKPANERVEAPAKPRKVEREDNRGNRFDPTALRRKHKQAVDDRQPEMDPIARLYGLADRAPEGRSMHLSDGELDRINGNRARGPDPNVMAPLDFRELRAERAHVNLLLEAIDDRREGEEDSLSLRFAMHALQRAARGEAPNGPEQRSFAGGPGPTGNDPRRKRRRRK